MQQVTRERRIAPRYPLILQATVTVVDSGATLSARTSDISRTGCYIDTLNPCPAGTVIVVSLAHSTDTFQTRARVVYESPGLGMGVMFLDVPPNQQALLDAWLATLASP